MPSEHPIRGNSSCGFPDHDALSEFRTHREDAQILLEVQRVYNPTKPDAGPWYGLTELQREAIMLAAQTGYYDIPRGCTTKELADELGISDQAVTERLRRAIVSLVTYTLVHPSRRAEPSHSLVYQGKSTQGWRSNTFIWAVSRDWDELTEENSYDGQ